MKNIINYSIFLVVAIALYEWGSALDWEVLDASRLQIFPLLGLVAFSIMWWHFLLGFAGDVDPKYEKPKSLKGISSIFVFFLIILHPLLLFLQSNALGIDFKAFVESYVGDTNFLFVSYGTVAFFIFLAYDLAKRLKDKPLFKNNWALIDAIDDVAFLAVFAHSMMLGQHTAGGWFRYYWITLGATGAFFIAYKHWRRLSKNEKV
jgi:hypothetical protein